MNKCQGTGNIILNDGGQISTAPKEICNFLNDFFVNVASGTGPDDSIQVSEDGKWMKEIFKRHENHPSVQAKREKNTGDSTFHFIDVNVSKVKRKLQIIKPNKATGHDNIPLKIVKCTSTEIADTITHIINTSFKLKVFPDDLKYAEIVPILKKGNDMLKKNYRPVSILSVFDKIFETIITDQLTGYFKSKYNNMLCAYRKNYSVRQLSYPNQSN